MAKRLVPDEVWDMVAPLLPEQQAHARGRPSVATRRALTGVLFVLKTGIAWEDLPAELGLGSGMTCLRRLREWRQAGVWPQVQTIVREHVA